MIIRSPNASNVLFRLPIWVQGTPVAVDPSPNVTPPDASRFLDMQAPFGCVMRPNSIFLSTFAVGGTTLTYSPWRLDPKTGLWINAFNGNGSRTMTLGSSNMDTLNTTANAVGPGSRWFFQITAQTGGVTAFGVIAR